MFPASLRGGTITETVGSLRRGAAGGRASMKFVSARHLERPELDEEAVEERCR